MRSGWPLGRARGQQQQELVPAPPSDDIAAAHDRHGNPGDLAEGGVARVVTVGVVVALEVVEVEEHDGQRFTAAHGRVIASEAMGSNACRLYAPVTWSRVAARISVRWYRLMTTTARATIARQDMAPNARLNPKVPRSVGVGHSSPVLVAASHVPR